MESAYRDCAALFAFAQHPKSDITLLELAASMDALPPVICDLRGKVFKLSFREFLRFYPCSRNFDILSSNSSLILGLANFVLLSPCYEGLSETFSGPPRDRHRA